MSEKNDFLLKEKKLTLHDAACELQAMIISMEKKQKSLFEVGLASLGSTVGDWIDAAERAKKLVWPKGNPYHEK